MKMNISMLGISTYLLILVSSNTMAAPVKPDAGSDDCYNRATLTCNRKHPGMDMGDSVYEKCINDTNKWCDVNEPAGKVSGAPKANFNSGGKMKIAPAPRPITTRPRYKRDSTKSTNMRSPTIR